MKENKDYKDITILENGIVHYDSGMRKWTKEEVDELNNNYFEQAKTFIPQILADGYTEFPIMFEEGPDKVQWSSCWLPPNFMPSCCDAYKEQNGLKYNIYIPSYGRAGLTLTDKTLDSFGITNYYFCVNPDQYLAYKEQYGIEKVIVRDHTFKADSKMNLMSSMNAPFNLRAGTAFMNALIYMSRSLGEKAFWMLDDDLYAIGLKAYHGKVSGKDVTAENWKYNKDDFYRCSILKPKYDFDLKEYLCDMEDLLFKCRNRGAIALEKYGLGFTKPIGVNLGTRAYTFYLADTATVADHEGLQNNDTNASLEMGKRGLVNMIPRGVAYHSADTQQIQGGCTGAYTKFGTLDKTKCLLAAHPNYAKASYLFNRIHHTVDYNSYNKIRLVGAVKEKD